MNGLLLAEVFVGVVALLTGYLALTLFRLGLPLLTHRVLVAADRLPGLSKPAPAEAEAARAVEPDQSRWTALDDQQFARFLKDSPQ